MKEVLLYDIGDLRLVESPMPEVGPNDVLVAVRRCAVCPTDARKYKTGNHGVPRWPFNMGHEFSGDVVEIGDAVEGVRVGMRVLGVLYGAYAEFVKTDPHWLFELPDSLSYEEGAMAEPLGDCLHAVLNQAQVRILDTVVIVGAGQMGLQHLLLSKLVGAGRVIIIDVLEDRLLRAKMFGADHVVNAEVNDPVEAVKDLTDGAGADAVIVSVGIPAATNTAMQMVRKRGRVVLFGGYAHNQVISFDPNIIHYGEVILTGSYGPGLAPHYSDPSLYAKALDIIAMRKFPVPITDLITHRYPLEQVEQALNAVARHQALKAMIEVASGASR